MTNLFRNIHEPITQEFNLFLTLQIHPFPNSNKLQKLFPGSGKHFLSCVLKSRSSSFMEHHEAVVLQHQRENITSESQLDCTQIKLDKSFPSSSLKG